METVSIGLMGGSFDPIHLSHIALAKAAMEQGNLQKVLFLVSGNPPHKKKLGASAVQRLEMARLALQDCPWAEVSGVELRDGTVYTIDTLRLLKKSLPHARFSYIIGADTLLDLHSWRCFPQVAGFCGFLAAMREGVDHRPALEEAVRLQREYGAQIEFIHFTPAPISSTIVREKLLLGESTRGLLPNSLRSYIDQMKLYRKDLT